ncbi:MAG: hypothetical protein HOM44_00940, partial [Gammaproteobacteria bacterium]|nr:hypothetical protein [Gammaproteobacteria bacterium]
MTKPLKTLAVVVLLLLLSPFIAISGFGFYHGLDVPNGVAMFTRELLGYGPLESGAHRVKADELRILSKPVLWMGKLESEDLPETSGLAAFSTKPNLLFAVNDSGNPAGIDALTLDGKEAGHWPIDYPYTHDFEDLAAFTLDGKPYLLVADTGDNLHWRPRLNILVFDAPETVTKGRSLKLAWQFSFNFPEGYRDVEAVAVDINSHSIYLITKRQDPPEVFRLPLQPDDDVVTAKPVALLDGIPRPTERDLREDPSFGAYSSMPTAFDINGRDAVVVTYKEAYLYRRKLGQNWAEAFSGRPDRIRLPYISGLESVAFDSRGRYFYVTGEREDGIGTA